MWISRYFFSRDSLFPSRWNEGKRNKWENVNSSVEFNNLLFFFLFSLRRHVSQPIRHTSFTFFLSFFPSLSSLRFSFIISSGFLLAQLARLFSFSLTNEKEVSERVLASNQERSEAAKLVSFFEKLLSPLSRSMAVVLRNHFYQLPALQQRRVGERKGKRRGLNFRTLVSREWNQSFYWLSIWQRQSTETWFFYVWYIFRFHVWLIRIRKQYNYSGIVIALSPSPPLARWAWMMFNEFIRKSSFTILPNSYRIKFISSYFSSPSKLIRTSESVPWVALGVEVDIFINRQIDKLRSCKRLLPSVWDVGSGLELTLKL